MCRAPLCRESRIFLKDKLAISKTEIVLWLFYSAPATIFHEKSETDVPA